MTLLLIGLVFFLTPHMISAVNDPWRNRIAGQFGELTWKATYAAVSLVGFVMIVIGYDASKMTSPVLYPSVDGLQHLAALMMLPVFPLLLATYLPGRIQTLAKHPMLVATKLWAVAHLLVNGHASDLLLFGSFLIWAILVRLSYARREPRATPSAPRTAYNDLIAVVVGVGLYGIFVMGLHTALIGGSPLS